MGRSYFQRSIHSTVDLLFHEILENFSMILKILYWSWYNKCVKTVSKVDCFSNQDFDGILQEFKFWSHLRLPIRKKKISRRNVIRIPTKFQFKKIRWTQNSSKNASRWNYNRNFSHKSRWLCLIPLQKINHPIVKLFLESCCWGFC